uniref:Acetyl-CoA carboxylase beta subunit n=1 Tax=Chamaecyparis obtusa var. formosana TaxID=187462 RepID=A0A7R6ZVD0_CHAOB|nr:acetyl-CoA carboxylase beta subunit [Chamaecyparis obtusa var. formosana]BCB64140.1 acetyl-CoA carboxylase beta subunit [Chamaecyparis obtusa var. formosana]BCB64223.1 acetyl-CoA carboxylase beta subunit [Chamaecyparis obtusa var. formosana]BCB64555.1 acetyl-CoA carboxylase beta subunit [Chamaecyparis obtusa var. formosana]BCB64638.1 acetyl-CoA carboxylase beta subunit [Chamaecyparis obtusa var. formosana]
MCEEDKDSEKMCEEDKDSEKMREEDKDSEHINETKPVEHRLKTERFKHLWFMCENCETFIYKKLFLEQKGVCEECGATLQMTSSERIELLIDNGTWWPMDMNFSSIDVLEKQHTTFDIKMVQRVSTLLYKVIYDKYFDFEFFHEKNGLKTLVRYNITLVNIVKVVLGKKFIKYLNLNSKETIKILQNILDTGLKTVQFVLFEIHKKITDELQRFALLDTDTETALKDEQQLIRFMHILNRDTSFENDELISLLSIDVVKEFIDAAFDENDQPINSFFAITKNYIQPIQTVIDLLQLQNCLNLSLLIKLNKQLSNLKEQLLSQDKFLKVAAVNLVKMELSFPEEKRKARKRKKRFPFYPGNDPETNYFLWLRKHIAICLMEKYLVLTKFKDWFKMNCCGLLKGEEFYRFGSNILVEYVKKQDRYECYNIIDHIMHDDFLYSETRVELFRQIENIYNNEKNCDNNLFLCTEDTELIYLYLLEIMKNFATLALDSKEKFCKKKKEEEESDIEDTEDTEDIEEEYPLTYDSLTKEEKEYVDAGVNLVKKTLLKLRNEEFLDTETEEQCYDDYNTSYQKETGLPDAIQTGIGKINGLPVALGVMDFQFMGGSMGSVVGEKITRLIQYATEHLLPVILVCASGGARMQEGSFSLMQMNKIAAVLHTHQKEKNLLYISVLTSPTTGGVTASFGMLANVTIVEPNAYIAFAGKRVIEQTLNQIVDDEDQISDSLFDFGMFDSMVPRALLKNVVSEIIELYMPTGL